MKAYGQYVLVARTPEGEERTKSGLLIATSEPHRIPVPEGVVQSVGDWVHLHDEGSGRRLQAGDKVWYLGDHTRELEDGTVVVHESHVVAYEGN